MIRLNIREEDLENAESIVGIINSVMLVKAIYPSNNQTTKSNHFKYYDGELPEMTVKDGVDYEQKTFNLAKPITDTATKTFIGVLPDMVTIGKKEQKDKISVFNQKLYSRSFGTHIFQASKNASICGDGYIAVYNEQGDTFPRFKELNPRFSDVVYDCSLGGKKLFAFNIMQTNELVSPGSTNRTRYIIYIYTKKKIMAFESYMVDYKNPSTPLASQQLEVVPYGIFSVSGQITNEVEHGFNDIPIFEFPNNQEHKGDFECVEGLIDLYNELQNNRCLNVKDIVNYVLMLKNVRIGNDDEQSDFLDLLEKHRVLPVEGENADAKFLSNPLDQSTIETLAKSIKANIDLISRVPDLSGTDFSQNASDPIIKIKTKPLLDLCNEKELSFTQPYIELVKLVLEWCKKFDKKGYDKYGFDTDLISLKYAHPLPSNDLDMVTQITSLANSRMLPPEIALQEISWIPNVHDAIKQIAKHNEEIDKAKEIANNKNKQVANETNLERQKPFENDQLDNKRNGAIGVANRISDNKVE